MEELRIPFTLKEAFVKYGAELEGFFKLNVDGSYMETSGVMGAADIIRNHLGQWISGFSSFIGPGNSLAVEIWGISFGLKLASCNRSGNHTFDG
ncbi:putative ribonuclease H-like domain-containing protein [Senna tora]|uniref:Putative ribonuclease H-like domain-containing protein n=1 Tax=Senna tora TaxID=362788 RepID=A0A834WA58_9FABA|nr:putative ribonuclease H-like domain-containing protein [Senna tora]